MLSLAAAYLRRQPLSSALTVLLVALGVATLTVLLLLARQAEQTLAAGEGVDLVVGAEGSPLQLVLSAVYHLDRPTGNIPGGVLDSLRGHRAVARAVPLALGDSYGGVRIVGTDTSFVAMAGARIAEGEAWGAVGEAVVGVRAAEAAGIAVGDTLVSAHGLSAETVAYGHDETPLRVVGRLAPTGGPADGLILTSVETVWALHGIGDAVVMPPMPGEMPPQAPDSAVMPPMPPGAGDGRDLTAVLVQVASPLAVALLPREVAAWPGTQAAVPAREATRLLSLVGVGLGVLRLFGAALLAAALLSLFLALTAAMRQRRTDLAVLRALGASRGRLVTLVLAEGLAIAAAGVVLGLALGHAAVEAVARLAPAVGPTAPLTGWTWAPAEGAVVAAAFAVALVASAWPAWAAYRTDVAATLAEA